MPQARGPPPLFSPDLQADPPICFSSPSPSTASRHSLNLGTTWVAGKEMGVSSGPVGGVPFEFSSLRWDPALQ